MEIKQNEEKKTQENVAEVATPENQEEIELNPKNVHKLFQDCLFKEEEYKDGEPTSDFNYVAGIARPFIFNTERLNKNKSKIAALIDMLPLIPLPQSLSDDENSMSIFSQSFSNLCVDKNGRQWTGEQPTMELLMVLGIACGLIEYTYPREEWEKLFGKVPEIHKTTKNPDEVIVGEKPEEFSKYVPEEVKRKHEEEKEALEKLRVMAKETFEEHYKKAAPVFEMLGYSMSIEGENYYLYDNKGEKLCELSVTPILGGFSYEGVVNDTKVEYIYSRDGQNPDGGLIYRDIITVSNVKKRDEAYSGKEVKIELGVGLHNVSDVPRLEVTIVEPGSEDEKITKYYATPYNMSFEIENNFGAFGNYEDGTDRAVHYTNTMTNPFVNQGALLIHEAQQNGRAYNISIDRTNTYPEAPAKYAHRTADYKAGTSTNPDVTICNFSGRDIANEIACEYLKTPRVKNLYYHILEHIEAEVSGMKDYIHKNYPFIESVEEVMSETPAVDIEKTLNSFAIPGADLKCEKAYRTL